MKEKIWESKYHLFLLVIPCVLVLLIAFLVFQNVLTENINETNYEIMQETARQQMLSFEMKIQGQLNQLQLFARNFEFVDMNDYNEVKKVLNVSEGAGSFQTISVANSTGKLVSNHNTLVGNIMQEQYFKDGMEGNTAIGVDYFLDDEDTLQLIFAVPIYQEDEVIGILVGSEQLSEVGESVMTDSFGGLGATFIINNYGNILLNSANGAKKIDDVANCLTYMDDAKLSDAQNMQVQMIKNLTSNNTEVYRCSIQDVEYIMIKEMLPYNDWALILQVDASFVNSQRSQILICVLILLLVVLISMLIIVVALFRLRSYSGHLKNKAERDLLTNLLNKKTFERSVENIVLNHSADEAGALLIIDLDNFKGINDTLGHMAGDKVLSSVADKMRETFRQQDYLGRIGGDEFAVYFTFRNKPAESERRNIIQSRLQHFCEMVGEIGEEINVDKKISCSIGVSMDPEHGTSYEKLYKNADKALYQSKRTGKNQYTIFTKE